MNQWINDDQSPEDKIKDLELQIKILTRELQHERNKTNKLSQNLQEQEEMNKNE